MKKKRSRKELVKRYHHLSPLDIQAIVDARARGVKVTDLAKLHGTSRQTIYNALRAARETSDGTSTKGDEESVQILPIKRKRCKRISPEVKTQVEDLKRKYPTWGVGYIREQWIKAGNAPLSRSSIYKILRGAGLLTRHVREKETFHRFEMERPGQLWQVDYQGKIFLPGIGWIHGFSILDDYSRYIPIFRYFSDESMSNAILMLNEAIKKHGVPESIYVDNGSQFKSRGERLNNFELFCAAYSIPIVNSTPGRPQGKGKIERFFRTEEDQFIAWARVKSEENPTYSLDQLNKDVEAYVNQYNARVHGGTGETPAARFFNASLRVPDPAVDVLKFLERGATRIVNKYGEVSYKGYKIQLVLPAHVKVTVVETIETIRIEHDNALIREIYKEALSKEFPVKKQHHISVHAKVPGITPVIERKAVKSRPVKPKASRKKALNSGVKNKPDEDGFYQRKSSDKGKFRCAGGVYFVGRQFRNKKILVKIVGDKVHVFNTRREHLCTLKKREYKVKKHKPEPKGRKGKGISAENQVVGIKKVNYDMDADGFYHRETGSNGRFRCAGGRYYIGCEHKDKQVLVKIVNDKVHVFDIQRNLICILDVRVRKRP